MFLKNSHEKLLMAIAIPCAKAMSRVTYTMGIPGVVRCICALRLQSIPRTACLLYASKESEVVCKQKTGPTQIRSMLNIRSDLLCPQLKKVFGDHLKCSTPDVIPLIRLRAMCLMLK